MEYKTIYSSTMHNPLVSIIIPMYNVEDYIHETIESITCQTLKDVELILVDDGSKDNTIHIVQELVKESKNVTLVIKENSGPGDSRNIGIEISKGNYICFVDSDDILPVDALENMYEAAKKYNVDLVTGMSKSFNSEQSWFIPSHLNNGVYDQGIKDLFNNPEMLYSLGPCNKLFKKDLIQDVKFPKNIKVTEDHSFIIHAYLKAEKFYTLDKVIYYYRQREDEDNISLSQIVNEHSGPVVRDIMSSLKISDGLWDMYEKNIYKREKMKQDYYNRIIKADLWPAVNKCIKGKNPQDQKMVFKLLQQWIKEMEPALFNDLPLISHMLTFQVLNRYLYLSSEVKKIHLLILVDLYNKLNPDRLNILLAGNRGPEVLSTQKSAKRNSVLPMYLFLLKRNLSKKIKNTRKKIGIHFAKRMVFPLAKMLPIQKQKVMFATNKDQRFSGSFKVIFDEMMQLDNSYDIVGHFKRNRTTSELIKLYYDLATAKYVLLDDYYFHMYGLKTRKGTEVIQLWHAAGAFKKFGYSSIGTADSNPEKFEKAAHQNYTQVIVSGKNVSKHYADAFNISVDNVYPLGVPRTDVFLDEDYKQYIKESYINTYPQLENKKIITYAPTFRGGPGVRSSFNMKLDFKKLYEAFGEDYIVILKMHPSVTKGIYIPIEYQDFILDLSQNDVNNILIITDYLITDYSSIVFDYALLKRPIIFYAYDLEEYLNERGFYEEYEDFVPGPIVKRTEEIVDYIQKNHFDVKVVEDFTNKYFDHLDGQAGKRIVNHLFRHR